MAIEAKLEYDDVPMLVNNMWAALAEVLSAQAMAECERIKEGVSPEDVIRLARAAEACYWQAQGEADSSTVKDILCPQPQTT